MFGNALQVITTGPDGKTYTDSSLTYVLRDGQVVLREPGLFELPFGCSAPGAGECTQDQIDFDATIKRKQGLAMGLAVVGLGLLVVLLRKGR